ncbi:MAG: class I SAM-dependent methyltransferase [Bacilli bacterium]|nr:class I SAM-dependent methyltransferase [Bacilli bacterium]
MNNQRLNKILDLINVHDCVADIGTDHGYLLIGCMEKGLKFCQGVENKLGPYLVAEANLNNYIQDGRIKLSLSDGLKDLDPLIDTVVIAGMGGELISKIIDESLAKAKTLKKLILEPNVRCYELRKYLNLNGFTIYNEEIINDNDKYYEIMEVKFANSLPTLSENELLFGPILLKKANPLFITKWQTKLKEYENIKNTSTKKLPNIEEMIERIKEVIHD